MRLPRRGHRPHPRFRKSVRWWIADRTLSALLLLALAVLLVFSVLLAVGFVLAEDSSRPLGERLWSRQLLDVTLEVLRACVGTDSLSVEGANTAQEVLSTVASLTGALVPATLLGIALIKVFTVRPVVWRRKASIALAAMSDSPNYARDHQGSDKAVIAVRFYNHVLNLVMMEARAEAHLRFLEKSPHADTLVMYKQRLKILGEDGGLCDERVWSVVERAAPFTVWIPVGSEVPELPLGSLQGKDLRGLQGVRIMVRFTAKAVGTGAQLSDERWFKLDDSDLELGKFVSVEPDLDVHVSKWKGWREFDELQPDAPPEDSAPPAS
ncbi:MULTISPECIES: hypothetical protein [Streptomyces]|uniref:Uncharacterized protein n=1 Tax=Streptomyces lutosisoli TaxID=2665721 RepID=A0ABW2VCB5_9ACTN